MYLLLSGEGRSDIGECYPALERCDAENFKPGTMAILIDQLITAQIDYSLLDYEQVGFVSKPYLIANKLPPKARTKGMALRGKKTPKETKFFYENARALAHTAKQKTAELQDKVIAVLFRDVDGTASAERGTWQSKVDSMIKGFADEDYSDLGVPMMPNPKSEAWLLCAVKKKPYQHCHLLESESGNDRSQNPLKKQLTQALADAGHQDSQAELVKNAVIDINKIDMPSLNDFKSRLYAAVIVAQKKQ